MPTKDEIFKFSKLIDDLAREKRCDIMDAIVLYCEETGFEIELAATLLSAPLKLKIAEQAEDLNLLKKQSRLPI